jgi:uncharacterized CHY-type Zn-finger protein
MTEKCTKCNSIVLFSHPFLFHPPQKIAGSFVSAANDTKFHPDCFQCPLCEESLVNSQFVMGPDSIPYCEECFKTQFAQTCTACDQPISGHILATTDDRKFHPECFTCNNCNKQIDDAYYITPEQNLACVECFQQANSTLCPLCHKPVEGDAVQLDDDQIIHQACFVCTKDNASHVMSPGTAFHMARGQFFCSQHFAEEFNHTCDVCHQLVAFLLEIFHNLFNWNR